METTITVKTENLNETCPVYCQYQGQHQPQPAYIELDCRAGGELEADYSGEIGNAVPMYYWHNLAVRWGIPAETTGTSLQTLFSDSDFLACCQSIVDGFDDRWDGSNWVGTYTENAQAAIEEAERIITAAIESAEVSSAEEWLFSSCSLREHWDRQPIAEAVAELEGYIESNWMIDGDLEEALIDRAMSDYEYHPDRLTETHIAELVAREKITALDATEWRKEYAA